MRLAPLLLIACTLTACATTRRPPLEECAASLAAPDSTATGDATSGLAGDYLLLFEGLGGAAQRRVIAGHLSLQARPATDPAAGREPFFGSTDLNLESIGAFINGNVASADPAAPGVAIRRPAEAGSAGADLEMRFGSRANRGDRSGEDGPLTVAWLRLVAPGGFAGDWESTAGYTGYQARGRFCARRVDPAAPAASRQGTSRPRALQPRPGAP